MKEVMNMDMEQTASWETRLRAKKQLEMFTAKYYAACAAGGMISAGSVHFLITPFDMMKVNMQVGAVSVILSPLSLSLSLSDDDPHDELSCFRLSLPP
jgi:hypothetical protein